MSLFTLLILWPFLALTIGLLIAPWFKRKCAGQSIEDDGCERVDALASPRSVPFHTHTSSAGGAR